jgi:hypothetical protein
MMDCNSRLKAVIAGLRSAKGSHPEIDFAGFETSIAKRVLGELGIPSVEMNAMPASFEGPAPTREAHVSEFLGSGKPAPA